MYRRYHPKCACFPACYLALGRWEWLRGVLDQVAALNGNVTEYRKLVDSGRVMQDVGS